MATETFTIARSGGKNRYGDPLGESLQDEPGGSVSFSTISTIDEKGFRTTRQARVVWNRLIEAEDVDAIIIRGKRYTITGVEQIAWRWSAGSAGTLITAERAS